MKSNDAIGFSKVVEECRTGCVSGDGKPDGIYKMENEANTTNSRKPSDDETWVGYGET